MNKEQLTVNNEKTCVNCSHCKVSRKSLVIRGLCYCDKKKQLKEKSLKYWLIKKVCRLFDDMTA